jgi:hypothetical protein
VIDRYTKTVLTVIAGALLYLCIVVTAFPAAHAQSSLRPGEPTGPGQVVVVGWRVTEPLPVAFQRPVPVITTNEPLRITGTVATERSGGVADRVILAGWEEGATREKATRMTPLIGATAGLPVKPQQ